MEMEGAEPWKWEGAEPWKWAERLSILVVGCAQQRPLEVIGLTRRPFKLTCGQDGHHCAIGCGRRGAKQRSFRQQKNSAEISRSGTFVFLMKPDETM